MRPLPPLPPLPAVSVIVPTYERREWVGRAVRSVLAQTFSDFELIVIDDGSTDGTGKALTGLDPRLRYHWQENRGPGAARNTGIRLARGGIVAFLDSDNRWRPCHLEVVTEVLRLYPDAVLATTCPREHLGGRCPPSQARLVDFLPLALADTIFTYLTCVAVRASDLRAVKGFAEELDVMEDADLYLRLAARGPFALLRRRTIVHQLTHGSRLRRGTALGTYVPTYEVVSRRAVEAVAAVQRSDRPALEAMARGRLRYAAALRALADHDDAGVATNLREACRLLPELSRQSTAVPRRIERAIQGRRERARALAVVAKHWPDPASDTAVLLRLKAVAAACRAGRPGTALGPLRGLSPVQTGRFLVANLGLFGRLWCDAIRHSVHRGRDPLPMPRTEQSAGAPSGGKTSDLDPGGDVADYDGTHGDD